MEQPYIFEEKFKEALRLTFKIFIDFLNAHNIEWWCDGGTCLGTIRHKDLIPWDDDVDIMLPRKEYNRLLSLSDDLRNHTCLELRAIQIDQCYNHTYAKVINSQTTIWEQKTHPVIEGVWIDIFVLDNYNSGQWALFDESNHYKSLFIDRYKSIQYGVSLNKVLSCIKNGNFKQAIYLFKAFFYGDKMALKAYNDFISFDHSIQHDFGVNYASFTEGAYVYNKKWFSKTIEMPFSDFKVKVPVGYDDYLTYVYGDYMTPPNPIPSYTHNMYYVNLKERLDLKEVKRRIKKGEKFVC